MEKNADSVLLSFSRLLTVLCITLEDGSYVTFSQNFNKIKDNLLKIKDERLYKDISFEKRLIVISKLNKLNKLLTETVLFVEQRFFAELTNFYVDLVLLENSNEIRPEEIEHLKNFKIKNI